MDTTETTKIRTDGKNDKAAVKVSYADNSYCMSWQGEYDTEDNPLYNGKLYLPGVRNCGHRDCVRKSHIGKKPKSKRQVKSKVKTKTR